MFHCGSEHLTAHSHLIKKGHYINHWTVVNWEHSHPWFQSYYLKNKYTSVVETEQRVQINICSPQRKIIVLFGSGEPHSRQWNKADTTDLSRVEWGRRNAACPATTGQTWWFYQKLLVSCTSTYLVLSVLCLSAHSFCFCTRLLFCPFPPLSSQLGNQDVQHW